MNDPLKDLLVWNAHLVDRDMDCPGAVLVRAGKIAAIFTGVHSAPPFSALGVEVLDAGGKVLMPSFVDMHAHFRDPGYTEKEDLESGSRAACAGGFGTVVLMANTKPVISDQAAALAVRVRASEIGLVDVFQAVSLTRSFDGKDTSGLDGLDPSSVPLATEDGREVASPAVMLEAMKKCALSGVIAACHCEDPVLASAAKPYRDEALRLDPSVSNVGQLFADGEIHAEARSALFEAEALLRTAEDTMTERNLGLARIAGCQVHIDHVSTAASMDAVRRAKQEEASSRVTCEVTPHHIALNDSLSAIVNPPLRRESDRLALIDAILDGTVDAIATDHAPHTDADKIAGAPGFSGIQIAFPVCNTALVKAGYITLSRLSDLMSANPARILGLMRGRLQVGFDADLVILDPDAEIRVNPDDPAQWFSKSRNTPLAGAVFSGKILQTFLCGRSVYRV